MKHLFYFIALAPILWEMICVASPKKVHLFSNRMKSKKGKEYTDKETSFGVLMLLYIVWTFIGLFSFQWWAFAALIAISVLIPKRFIVLRWIDSLISLAILIFVIVNAYHLQITL